MPLPINNLGVESGLFIPDKYRVPLEYVIRNICENLNGYGDNDTTLPIGSPGTVKMPFDEYMELAWSLEYLAEENIITYAETESEYSIEVINRYKLALLNLPQGAKQSDIPNLVYYHLTTGKGFVNGHPITLTGRSKKLFDLLFAAAPESVDRKTLLSKARSGKYKNAASSYVVSEAFSTLRKACAVNATVIKLHGSGRLNAEVFRLSD